MIGFQVHFKLLLLFHNKSVFCFHLIVTMSASLTQTSCCYCGCFVLVCFSTFHWNLHLLLLPGNSLNWLKTFITKSRNVSIHGSEIWPKMTNYSCFSLFQPNTLRDAVRVARLAQGVSGTNDAVRVGTLTYAPQWTLYQQITGNAIHHLQCRCIICKFLLIRNYRIGLSWWN